MEIDSNEDILKRTFINYLTSKIVEIDILELIV